MSGLKTKCPQHLRATAVSAHDVQACSMLRARDGLFSGKLLVGGPEASLQVGTEADWSIVLVHGNVAASAVQASTGQVAILKVGSEHAGGELEVGTNALPGSVTVHGEVTTEKLTTEALALKSVNVWIPLNPPPTFQGILFKAQSVQAFSVMLTDTATSATGYRKLDLTLPEPLKNQNIVHTATYDTSVAGYAVDGSLLPVLISHQNNILNIAFGWNATSTNNRVVLIHVHIALLS